MKGKILATGIGAGSHIVRGKVINYKNSHIDKPGLLRGRVVYVSNHIPLYVASFLTESKVKGVLLAKGGKNYHPLILLNEASIPAISGIGELDIEGKEVTVDSQNGKVYLDNKKISQRVKPLIKIKTTTPIYVNVGYPTAIRKAAQIGADGIGLLRTEFIIARALSKLLKEEVSEGLTVKKALSCSNEADIVYKMAKKEKNRKLLRYAIKEAIIEAIDCFEEKEIIIRTLDMGREANEPMGNRGIRRCIAEGGNTIR